MSRYIDADKVLKELHLNHKDVIYIDKNDTAKRIEKIKGIDIVFCKECKFNYGNEHNCEYNPEDIVCTYWASDGLRADDFCSYGEREGE